MIQRWKTVFGDWLTSVDPGALRREIGLRALLAITTAWLGFRAVEKILSSSRNPTAQIYAVAICFLCFLIVIDRWPAARQRTTALCVAPAMVATLFVALFHGHSFLAYLVLLAMIFTSFAARRYSTLIGSLILFCAMASNIAWVMGATFERIGWFLLSAAIGVASAYLWQFIVLPRSAGELAERAVRSLRESGATAITIVAQHLELGQTLPEDEINRRIGLVEGSRRTIDGQLAVVRPITNTSRRLLNDIRLTANNFERGVRQILEAAERLAPEVDTMPAEIRQELVDRLKRLQRNTRSGAIEPTPATTDIDWDRLRNLVDRPQEQRDQAGWRVPAGRLAVGGLQVANSIRAIDELKSEIRQIGASNSPDEQSAPMPPSPHPPVADPALPLSQRLHPTLVIAIQATLATGLTMLLSWLFGLEHKNWAFLAAFAVVAGSTGESIRRIVHRVIGTIAGGMVGIAISGLVPDGSGIRPILVGICLFLVIFFAASSYPLMVASLTVGLALAYTGLGGSSRYILVGRSWDTILGAVIGGLVVSLVLPIRIEKRYGAALLAYLNAIDRFIAATLETLAKPHHEVSTRAYELPIQSAYDQLERTLPAVAFEFNPLTQTRSPLTQQSTTIASVNAAISQLVSSIDEIESESIPPRAMRVYQAFADRIHVKLAKIEDDITRRDAPSDPTRSHSFQISSVHAETEHEIGAEPGSGQRLVRAALAVDLAVTDLARSLDIATQTGDAQ